MSVRTGRLRESLSVDGGFELYGVRRHSIRAHPIWKFWRKERLVMVEWDAISKDGNIFWTRFGGNIR